MGRLLLVVLTGPYRTDFEISGQINLQRHPSFDKSGLARLRGESQKPNERSPA